jgi:dynein heavy chain
MQSHQGPFEARIEEWNRKLYTVSEVLEAWLGVQRNWLYLQPIFESPDINKQLPAEGKKFAMVDKNWRQAISSAKGNAKVRACDGWVTCLQGKDDVQTRLVDPVAGARSLV